MSERNVYNGGIVIGANGQATGAGGHFYNQRRNAPASDMIPVSDAELEPILVQFAKLQAALHLSGSQLHKHIGAEVAALSGDVSKSRNVDQSRVTSLLSKIERGATVTRTVADAIGAVSSLLGLG